MEHLSRGMRQKISLARALWTSPMLMLFDEPTTGLDPRSKKDAQGFINAIRADHDASILLCAPDMGEAGELCDRIGIMLNGDIIEMDVAAGLKRRHQSNGHLPSLEEVFMAVTESTFEEAEDRLPREKEKAGVT